MLAAFEIAEHLTDFARGFHDDVHEFRTQRQLVVAQLVEEVFGQVAERDHLGGVQKARAPLDGVKTTEDVVEQVVIVRGAFEIDELVIDTREQIARFHQKILEKVFHSGKVTHDSLSLRLRAHDGQFGIDSTNTSQKPRLSSRSSTCS